METHKKSLDMRRATHGHDKAHPDFAHSLNEIGNVYHDQGDYEEAAIFYEQCLELGRAMHGANSVHSNIASS